MIIAACCRFQGAATPCEAHLAHGESAAACVLRRARAPLVTNLKHSYTKEVKVRKECTEYPRKYWSKQDVHNALNENAMKQDPKGQRFIGKMLTTSGGDGDGGVGPGFGGLAEVLVAYEGSMLIPHNPKPLLSSFKFRCMRRYPFSPQYSPHEFFTIQ